MWSEPRNDAERRAAEVRKTRGPRQPIDPDLERVRIESRETERWVDEGAIRDEAVAATVRAAPRRERRAPELDPEVVADVHVAATDPRRAARLVERLTAASGALDRERFEDARRMVSVVVREAPQLAAGHEISGLACYRLGRWRDAAEALETARQLHEDPTLLPVLADCYRALRRWADVEAVWRDVRASSPSHEVMTEARIVVAGAHADRGELREAIALLSLQKPAKKVREHHVRQWYALADLLDRAGDTVGATRWFREVLAVDPDFADTRQRLRSLGR
jgi:tetratricopeptide (TPR) repeat protein